MTTNHTWRLFPQELFYRSLQSIQKSVCVCIVCNTNTKTEKSEENNLNSFINFTEENSILRIVMKSIEVLEKKSLMCQLKLQMCNGANSSLIGEFRVSCPSLTKLGHPWTLSMEFPASRSRYAQDFIRTGQLLFAPLSSSTGRPLAAVRLHSLAIWLCSHLVDQVLAPCHLANGLLSILFYFSPLCSFCIKSN